MTEKRKRNRSPLYPFVDLETAVGYAETLYREATFYYVPFREVIGYIGQNPTSSHGMRSLSAVGQFGLTEEKGTKEDRQVRLSELGKRIVLGKETGGVDYEKTLIEAVLTPKIFARLWKKYEQDGIPPDPVVRNHLILAFGFNPKAVGGFIKDFRASFRFAKLVHNGVSSEDADDKPGDAPNDPLSSFHDLFAGNPFASPQAEGASMSAQPRTPAQTEKRTLDYPVARGNGDPIAALRVYMPLDKETFELLEMEMDHRLNMLAKMLGIKRGAA